MFNNKLFSWFWLFSAQCQRLLHDYFGGGKSRLHSSSSVSAIIFLQRLWQHGLWEVPSSPPRVCNVRKSFAKIQPMRSKYAERLKRDDRKWATFIWMKDNASPLFDQQYMFLTILYSRKIEWPSSIDFMSCFFCETKQLVIKFSIKLIYDDNPVVSRVKFIS